MNLESEVCIMINHDLNPSQLFILRALCSTEAYTFLLRYVNEAPDQKRRIADDDDRAKLPFNVNAAYPQRLFLLEDIIDLEKKHLIIKKGGSSDYTLELFQPTSKARSLFPTELKMAMQFLARYPTNVVAFDKSGKRFTYNPRLIKGIDTFLAEYEEYVDGSETTHETIMNCLEKDLQRENYSFPKIDSWFSGRPWLHAVSPDNFEFRYGNTI